jgi:hypothetical protein
MDIRVEYRTAKERPNEVSVYLVGEIGFSGDSVYLGTMFYYPAEKVWRENVADYSVGHKSRLAAENVILKHALFLAHETIGRDREIIHQFTEALTTRTEGTDKK